MVFASPRGGHDGGADAWPVRVKNFLFRKARAGAIDLHYRDYEEPPGNGGFLLNGGRLYLDMGHIEYASPECLHLARHGGLRHRRRSSCCNPRSKRSVRTARVSFIKNNIDHHTGATFGCHENYLMKREAQFTPPVLGTLLAFLATRQIFTGAGRVGQANPLAFEFELRNPKRRVDFQISQRADHIVNDIYQWVQFNRAIINARDEPLADYRKYRRLHLLIGDSNMSPFATALKIGTTACVLTLLEEGHLPKRPQPESMRFRARARSLAIRPGPGSSGWKMANDSSASTSNGVLRAGAQTSWRRERRDRLAARELEFHSRSALATKPDALIGGVDWITKKWLLETFMEAEGLSWDDPWLQSLDLEYHNIDPEKGLFFGVPRNALGMEQRRAATGGHEHAA